MARYIDADKIHYPVDKRETGKTDWHRGVLYMKDTIDRQPTANVVEVKHGRWIDNGERDCNGVPKVFAISCSVCGSSAGASWMPYCPRCGAKMDVSKMEITTGRIDSECS